MAGFTFGSSFGKQGSLGARFRKCILAGFPMKSYEQDLPARARIKLDLTTNPIGMPKAVAAMLRTIDIADMHHYGEPAELPELKQALAEHSGTSASRVMLTAGADQAIEIALIHILEPKDRLGILIPTFPRFEIVAKRLCGAETVFFSGLERIPSGCKAIFLCTPNNPTTNELELSEIESAICANPDTFFIIDSVFSSFGRNDVSALVRKFSNLLVLKSLSKSFGLASFRVGWIEARPGVIAILGEGASPFRVPLICQKAALAALSDRSHIPKTLSFLSREFARINSGLGGNAIRHSNVPFFLFPTPEPQEARARLQKEHGISVVDSSSFRGASFGFLRVAIGAKEQNDVAIAALAELKSIKPWHAL